MRLPRAIRLDPSDAFIFDPVAEPGEWVVPGAFRFWGADPADLSGKPRQAFRSGFLGLSSFGWSTLATVSEATSADREAAVTLLAQQLVRHMGAPSEAGARPAAEGEIAFAASLCDHPVGTILAVERTIEDGEIRERFRTLHRRAGARLDPARAFAFVPVEEEKPAEDFDIRTLGRTGS